MPRLSVVPKGVPPAPIPAPDPSARETEWVDTDLSLPPEIATPLAAALEGALYKLEPANTAKLRTNNVRFDRIVGRSDAGTCSAALLYFDQSRVDAHDTPWLVYSLCIRICKQFRTREHDTLCVIFLAPEGTRFPETWTQQAEDIEELNIVRAVRFRRVAPPAMWRNADIATAMQDVHDWTRNLDLRPLSDAADIFSGPRQGTSQLSPLPAKAAVLPMVFVSYAHRGEDPKWCDLLLKEIEPLIGPRCRVWTDHDIKPGTDWSQNIDSALESCQIVILLVSESFLASEFIQNVELKRALDAAAAGKKKVLWVYARKVFKLDERITRWQAAHEININEPLERMSPDKQKEHFFMIYDALEQTLKDLSGDKNP